MNTSGSPSFRDEMLPSSVAAGLTAMAMLTGSGAPVDGVTGANVAPKGTFYQNTDNGQYYVNQGTLAVPEWHILIQG